MKAKKGAKKSATKSSAKTKKTAAKKNAAKKATAKKPAVKKVPQRVRPAPEPSHDRRLMARKVAGTPERKESLASDDNRETDPQITLGKKHFKTRNDFIDDSDDDQEISAELFEAGVDEAVDEDAEEVEREEEEEDREFQLSRQALEPGGVPRLADEDRDLDRLPGTLPLKADREP